MSKKIKEGRHLIITAYPSEPGRLRSVFTPVEGSIRKLIENPPHLRQAGWNLPTHEQAKIIRGEFIRVGDLEYGLLNVYRDGTAIYAVRADEGFLAWATPQNEQRINPTALVEIVYNFASFYEFVLKDFEQKPYYLFIRADLINMHLNGVISSLLPYPSTWSFRMVKPAPEENMSKTVEIHAENFRPEAVSFELLREIYLWFGFEEDKIPYTKVKDGRKEIDPDQILKLNG